MLFGTQAWSEEPFSFAVLGQGSGGTIVEGTASLSFQFDQTTNGGRLLTESASLDSQFDQTTTGLTQQLVIVTSSSQFDMTVTPVIKHGGEATMDFQFDQSTQSTNLSLNIATLSTQFDQTTTPTYISTGNTSTMSSVFETTKTDVSTSTEHASYIDLGDTNTYHSWTGQSGTIAEDTSGDFTLTTTGSGKNPNPWNTQAPYNSTYYFNIQNNSGSTITINNSAESTPSDWGIAYRLRSSDTSALPSNPTVGITISHEDTPSSAGGIAQSGNSVAPSNFDGTQKVYSNLGVSTTTTWNDGENLRVTLYLRVVGQSNFDALPDDLTIDIDYFEMHWDGADSYSASNDPVTDGFRVVFADATTTTETVGGDITALKIASHESTASAEFDQTTAPNKVHGAVATMDANVTYTTDAVKTVSADATMDANVTQTSTPNAVRGFSGYIIGNSEHTDGGSDRLRTSSSSMESIYEQAADAIRRAGGVASMDSVFEKTVDEQIILSLTSTMDMNFPQTSDAIRLAGGTASMDANFTDTTVGNKLLQVFNLDINSQFDQTSAAIKRMFGTTSLNMLFDADFAGDFLWKKDLLAPGSDGAWINIDADQLTETQLISSTVTVATGTNQYGTGNKYYIQGYTGASPTITIEEGKTFRFTQADPSNATHPLRFSTTPNGTWGGGVEYTTGVTIVGTAGQAGAYTQITVAKDTPTLYYYCVNHSGMGGQINTPGSLWTDLATGETISGNWQDRVV